jgi:DNA-binding MarR family transcriptional regulator
VNASGPDETAHSLAEAMRRLRARLRHESPPALADLAMPQAAALGRIVQEGPISNAALAAAEYVRPQSMHEIVVRLLERGLVERRPDPEDARKLLFEATDRGRRVVGDLVGMRHDWLAKAIDQDLTAPEQDILAVAARIMERLAASP